MAFNDILEKLFCKKNPPRLIVYGDIHGCLEEFDKLRSKIKLQENDVEVSVGDFITKGKDSIGVIDYMIEHNIKAVLGNHEDKLLRYIEHTRSKKKNPIKLDNDEKEIIKNFRKKHFEYLSALPIYLKFKDITIVHGGLQNHIKLDNLSNKSIQKILRLRYVDEKGNFVAKGQEEKKSLFWADIYDGHEGFIIHGHRWDKNIHIHENAIGIDTGCVYGNKLSAIVFNSKSDYRIVQQNCINKIKS